MVCVILYKSQEEGVLLKIMVSDTGILAEALLRYVEARAKCEGAEYMWVQHGTANPNARGFWNKYFSTYEYELVRTIY